MSKISSKSIFEGDVFKSTKDEALLFLGVLKDLKEEFKEIIKAQAKIAAQPVGNSVDDVKKHEESVKKLTLAEKELIKTEKAIQKTRAQLDIQQSEEVKELEKLRQKLNSVKKERREEIKLQQIQGNAYKLLSKRVNEAQAEFKRLAIQFGINSKQARRAKKELVGIQNQLMQVDAAARDGRRNVGRYGTALQGLGSKLKGIGLRFVAFTGLVYGLGRAMIGSFRTIRDFQQANANLASVLGKSRSEIKALTNDAKRLGSTTSFTASEVTKLQIAFSKLGFDPDQILNATEATLSLAAATGTELEEAATVAASTLNSFGLDASETQRVVDVMAKSFSSSALDMSKYSTAMAIVGPVAKTANLSIEQTTGLLGTLVDAGIDASTAGTGLRNIFLDLSKSGMSFEEAMESIRTSTNKNATAMELFGKRGATVATVLADNSENAEILTKKLNNAGGAAKKMADEQLDTLSGATTRLSSAWEGFILSLEDGDGVISQVLRSAIDFTTELVNRLTELTLSAEQLEAKRKQDFQRFGTEGANERQATLNEIQEMSVEEIREFIEEQEKIEGGMDSVASSFLSFIEGGYSRQEAKIKVMLSLAQNAAELSRESKEIIEEMDGDVAGVASGLFDKQRNEVIQLDAIVDQSIKNVRSELKKLSEEELLAFKDSSLAKLVGADADNLTELEKRNKVTVGLINQELKRRESVVKGTDEEKKLTEEKGKQLTTQREMARLQKELRDAEADRSDELIRNNGLETERFDALTKQTKELRDQIKEYERILEINRENDRFTERFEGNTVADAVRRGNQGQQELATESENAQQQITLSMLEILHGANEDQLEKEKEIYAERLEAAQTFFNQLIELENQRLDKKLENIDKDIEASKERESQLRAIANQSQLTDQQSIASEIKRQEELNREKARIERQKQRRETIARGLDLLSSNIQKGDGDPTATTIRQMTTLLAALSGLQGFYKGTDNAPEGLAWTDEKGAEIHTDKDGNIKDWGSSGGARIKHLSKGDKILTAEQSKIVKSNIGAFAAMQKKEQYNINKAVDQSISRIDTNRIVEAINNQPKSSYDYDPIAQAVIHKITEGNKVTENHYINAPKFG